MRSRREDGWSLRGIGEFVDDVAVMLDSIPVCWPMADWFGTVVLSTHLIPKKRVNTLEPTLTLG